MAFIGWAAACFDPTDTPSPGDGTGHGTGSSGAPTTSVDDDDGGSTHVADASTSGTSTDGSSTTATTSIDESSSTGAACVPGVDMCVTDEDCSVGTCVGCQCVYDYGPCDTQPCDCVPPANSICFAGGCFCYVPCPSTSSAECPHPSGGSAVPVCASGEIMEYACGLGCALAEDCPAGMACVAVPDGLPMWGDAVCVFPF